MCSRILCRPVGGIYGPFRIRMDSFRVFVGAARVSYGLNLGASRISIGLWESGNLARRSCRARNYKGTLLLVSQTPVLACGLH